MQIGDIIIEIETLSSPQLAQSWDNVGLLVGDGGQKTERILLTIDLTKAVLWEAIEKKCKMIVSYHPVIWDGLKKIAVNTQGQLIYEIIRAGISVYSIHTSLDVIDGGVNDGLAEIIGIKNPIAIGDFVSMPNQNKYKLIVFVPKDSINDFAEAVFAAGAGSIGNYSNCAFKSVGQGSFKPVAGAKPFIGKLNKIEKVDEIKFETIVEQSKLENVINAVRATHPYEEPAFDIIRLEDIENTFGLGRMGELIKPSILADILAKIKKATGCEMAGIVGRADKKFKNAAVCAGTCGKILNKIIAAKCDLYLTGELKHHEAIFAQEAGLTVICLSHSNSERFILKNFAAKLGKKLKNVKILVSKKDKDPFDWIQI